jgi:Arc/MetJ-type ribon-helix-helix transcriptional regulator
MPRETMRTHVVIPKELVDSIDDLVGRRSRSKFLTEAAEEKLARVRLARAAAKVVGSLADRPTPGWESSGAAARWVSDSRRADDERLRERLGRR